MPRSGATFFITPGLGYAMAMGMVVIMADLPGWLFLAAEPDGKVVAMSLLARFGKVPFWSWVWFTLGSAYFILPLYATFDFSLRMERDTIGFQGL